MHMQIYDVTCCYFMAGGECQDEVCLDCHSVLNGSPYFPTARHIVAKHLPCPLDGDGVDELHTAECWHGCNQNVGVPGCCSSDVRTQYSHEEQWLIVPATITAALNHSIILCPNSAAMYKVTCGHPQLTPSSP